MLQGREQARRWLTETLVRTPGSTLGHNFSAMVRIVICRQCSYLESKGVENEHCTTTCITSHASVPGSGPFVLNVDFPFELGSALASARPTCRNTKLQGRDRAQLVHRMELFRHALGDTVRDQKPVRSMMD